MRKLMMMMAILCTTMIMTTVNAQSFKIDKDGKIIKTEKSEKSTKEEVVYQIIDSTTFYIGTTGSIYYYKTSKKTNKPYRVYLKPEEEK